MNIQEAKSDILKEAGQTEIKSANLKTLQAKL